MVMYMLLVEIVFVPRWRTLFMITKRPEGQLVLKVHFGFFNPPKKQRKISAQVG